MNDHPPINGVRTFSCTSEVHHKCGGAWFSFTRMTRVACACHCHIDAGQATFDLGALA